MLIRLKVVILVICIAFLTACSSIEETYKPLYQVKPEKHAIKGGL